MTPKAQGAMEYLLIFAGGVLIAAVAIALIGSTAGIQDASVKSTLGEIQGLYNPTSVLSLAFEFIVPEGGTNPFLEAGLKPKTFWNGDPGFSLTLTNDSPNTIEIIGFQSTASEFPFFTTSLSTIAPGSSFDLGAAFGTGFESGDSFDLGYKEIPPSGEPTLTGMRITVSGDYET